jgi:hypothetical protein
MTAMSYTRSVDIEDDIKRRRPPIHPPICIWLVLRPGGRGIELHAGGGACASVEPTRRWRSPLADGGARAPVDLCHRWRSPLAGGAARLVEDPAHRWRSLCAGGSCSPVEERTCQWSCVSVEEPTHRWRSSLAGAWMAGCKRAQMEVAWNPRSQMAYL